jgi:hypothetical protein
MRKAFDANVPKLKPRLRTAVAAPTLPSLPLSPATEGERPGEGDAPRALAEPNPRRGGENPPSSSFSPEGSGEKGGAVRAEASADTSVDSRRDRLEKIKRRVAEASRPRAASIAVPTDPARAAESVLGLVRELENDLARARQQEEALRTDLEASRAES